MSALPMDPNFNIGQIPTTQFNIPQPKPRGGMFGGGGSKALSALAEALAAYSAGMGNPGGMAVLQGMNHRRQSAADAEAGEEQYQRQRSDGMADWMAKQEYEQAHPAPINNDTVADYNFRAERVGKEAADEWLRSPPQIVSVPGVGLVQVPRLGGNPSQPPQSAVEHLRANPNLKSDFDIKYGQGAADRILGAGGPTASPSAPFPVSF